MSEAPGVFTVVLSFNRPHLLPISLDSVLSQTHENVRVLIADNGSDAPTLDVARAYVGRHPGRIQVVHAERELLLSVLLNRCFEEFRSSGLPYFALLADDDSWMPDKLERQLAVFDAHPGLGLVHTDAVLIDDAGRAEGRRFSDLYLPRPDDQPALLLRDWNFVCGSSVLVSREALLDAGPIPVRVRYSNDCYLWILIALLHGSRRIEDPLTVYRLTSNSLTRTGAGEMQWESVYLRRLAIRELRRRGLDLDGAEEAVAGRAFFTAVDALRGGSPLGAVRIGWQSLRVGPGITLRTWSSRARRATAKRIARVGR